MLQGGWMSEIWDRKSSIGSYRTESPGGKGLLRILRKGATDRESSGPNFPQLATNFTERPCNVLAPADRKEGYVNPPPPSCNLPSRLMQGGRQKCRLMRMAWVFWHHNTSLMDALVAGQA